MPLCLVLGLPMLHGQKQGNAQLASRPWWKFAVIYQIYPRSFFDSDPMA